MQHFRITGTILTLALSACTGSTTKPVEGQAAVQTTDLAMLCGTTLKDCRGPSTIRLLQEDGSYFELSTSLNQPAVQNDTWVTIFPGETLYLEAEISGRHIVRLHSVPNIIDPDRTITLAFKQLDGKTDMMLSVKNPFPQHLKYRLGMETLDQEGLFKTSSCPAVANGGSYEHWPYPIFQLVATDFHLLPESDHIVCE